MALVNRLIVPGEFLGRMPDRRVLKRGSVSWLGLSGVIVSGCFGNELCLSNLQLRRVIVMGRNHLVCESLESYFPFIPHQQPAPARSGPLISAAFPEIRGCRKAAGTVDS